MPFHCFHISQQYLYSSKFFLLFRCFNNMCPWIYKVSSYITLMATWHSGYSKLDRTPKSPESPLSFVPIRPEDVSLECKPFFWVHYITGHRLLDFMEHKIAWLPSFLFSTTTTAKLFLCVYPPIFLCSYSSIFPFFPVPNLLCSYSSMLLIFYALVFLCF